MAHPEQENFVRKVKANKPSFFNGTKVVDFGSLDINGNNKMHFTGEYEYTGVDIGEGKNVNVVSKAKDFKGKDYDVVISTEMLEHDSEYVDSLKNMYNVCKDGGLIVITAATKGRPEHGTSRSDGGYSSPFTTEYYMNIEEKHFREAWNIEEQFSEFQFQTREHPHDIYFWGIKKAQVKKQAPKRGRKPKSKA